MGEMLNGQTAIISGALGDIGRAIALELAGQGSNVALGDILPDEEVGDVLQKLEGLGVRARYDRVDVTEAAAVADWVQAIEDDLGLASLIIPNAAIVTMKKSLDLSAEEWSRELRINLDGAFHLAQAGARRLVHHGKPGRIVFVGSWAGHRPHVNIPAYCASKAGIRLLVRCMAVELGPKDILVNEVAPGYVNAGLSGKSFQKNPDGARNARARVPVQRLIEAEEVAYEVLHLCDPKNRHMTGSVLLMDGGLSLNSGGVHNES